MLRLWFLQDILTSCGLQGLFQDVSPGMYIPIVRWKAPEYTENYDSPHITFLVTKHDNDNPVLLSMDGMPGTGASIPPETTFPSSLETSWASSHSRNTSEVIRAVINRGSEWSDMMLGPIQMSETATLRFQFGGPNPHGCGGMWFDCVQLVLLQKLNRGVKRSVEGFAASQRPNFFSGLPELAMNLVVREARLRLIKRDSGDDVVELL